MLQAGNLGSLVDLASGETWDASRLAAEIERRSALLATHGVGPGSRVAILHGGSAPFFADLLAVWRLGACAACLNAGAAEEEVANVVAFLEPDCLLVRGPEAVSSPAANAGPARLDLGVGQAPDSLVRDNPGVDRPATCSSPRAEDPALMLFTSGTTGAPKAVVHTFGSISARLSLNRTHIGEDVLEHTLCLLPTHFGHGLIGNCLTPLLAGKRLVLHAGGGLAAAASLGATLDEQGITFMSSVPAVWRLALRASRPPVGETLRQVCVGSAPLSVELWREIIAWTGTRRVVNMYGITEAANWIAGAAADELEPCDGLIGRPWGGELAVRGHDGRPQPEGVGELLVRSPALMQGYYLREDLTAEVMQDGWYRTGDVGSIDATGVARLTGRIRNEINRAGIKIHPEDIDLLLERHPEVAEACAFGIPDEVSGEEVAAAICIGQESDLTAEALQAWCAERIRQEAVPAALYFVPQIPKTDRGKVNRDNVRTYCLGERT